MKKVMSVGMIISVLFVGCSVRKPSVEEQISQKYDPNKEIQVIEIEQSHGLVGDAIDSVFNVFKQ